MSTSTVRSALSSLLTGMQLVKYGLSTLLLVLAASAFIALSFAPQRWFFVAWLAVTAALLGVFVGLAVGLRVLRARRFGDTPPTDPVEALDVVLGVGGLIAGTGGLVLAVPRLASGEDVRTWAFATALCLGALGFVVRDAVRYVTVR